MTKEQKIEAYSMRLDGATLREIADKFGVSFQYIQHLFPGARKDNKRRSSSIVYPNIIDFINENDISLLEFPEKCGVSYNGMMSFLLGKNNGSKKTIDKILEATGMKYEEAFAKERTKEHTDEAQTDK